MNIQQLAKDLGLETFNMELPKTQNNKNNQVYQATQTH